MNRVLCSKMTIRFADRKVNKISFYGQPESKLVPPKELKDADKQLDGFNWRMAEKPTKARILGLPETPPTPTAVLSATSVKKAVAAVLPEASATTKREVPVSESKMRGLIRKTTGKTVETAPVKETVLVNKPAPVPTVGPKKEIEKVKTTTVTEKNVQPVDSLSTETLKNTITKPALRTTPTPVEESDLEKELNKKPVRKTGN